LLLQRKTLPVPVAVYNLQTDTHNYFANRILVHNCDLHARHRWLVDRRSMVEELLTDPDWYDARAAGWWVWGISQWIGTGWCPRLGTVSGKMPCLSRPGAGLANPPQQLPALSGDSGATGRGVHRRGLTKDGKLWQQRPHLGGNKHEGMGIHRKMPHLSDAGHGAHRAQHLSRQVPELGNNRGVSAIAAQDLGHKMPFIASPSPDRRQHGLGIHGITHAAEGALYDYFRALAARLRRVRVVCGDFERVLGPSVTWRHGLSAIFLDPPYKDDEHSITYSGGGDVWDRVTRYCEENGSNPLLRIALCGYTGSWDAPEGWTAIKWRTPGGYGSQGNGRGRENAAREVVWFNKSCINPAELARDALTRPLIVNESDWSGTLFEEEL
jgi:hypothetical protein